MLAASAILAGSAAAETLVVRAAGPSARAYPPGTAIADSTRIVLQGADQLVLLDSRGTRTLKGPGTFSPLAPASPAGAAAASPSTLGALVAKRSDRRARIGAVRSVSAAGTGSPNIWFVDIDRSATVCVADPAAVTMWRGGTPTPTTETATIAIAAPGSPAAAIPWSPGAATMPWPASIPIVPDTVYNIRRPGAAEPTRVRFVMLGAELTGLESLASSLIRNGCTAQLDRLIETVALPEPAAATGG